ncbi:hypothetical protein [Collimonas pratensis]|uniref:Uncharacterized protein n=1 Tax=Collimonas pratensis TaxID=279113 RepID=A0A127Q5N6_9BURK|nr:hypothetical protein [Collimonas pratensis]AMP05343.1 hypothetical protein CPter91_3002 [Collimonas pratensis]
MATHSDRIVFARYRQFLATLKMQEMLDRRKKFNERVHGDILILDSHCIGKKEKKRRKYKNKRYALSTLLWLFLPTQNFYKQGNC